MSRENNPGEQTKIAKETCEEIRSAIQEAKAENSGMIEIPIEQAQTLLDSLSDHQQHLDRMLRAFYHWVIEEDDNHFQKILEELRLYHLEHESERAPNSWDFARFTVPVKETFKMLMEEAGSRYNEALSPKTETERTIDQLPKGKKNLLFADITGWSKNRSPSQYTPYNEDSRSKAQALDVILDYPQALSFFEVDKNGFLIKSDGGRANKNDILDVILKGVERKEL